MSWQWWLHAFQISTIIGSAIVFFSSIGITISSKVVNAQKEAKNLEEKVESDEKINELLAGNSKLLKQADAYAAENAGLKSKISSMQPDISLLEAKYDPKNSNKAMLILGPRHPVVIRQVDVFIEFSSKVKNATRGVIPMGGSGIATCNLQKPVISGNTIKITGGSLLASNLIQVNVETENKCEIINSNLKK